MTRAEVPADAQLTRDQRKALVIGALLGGEHLSTRQVAQILRARRGTAWRWLCLISRVLPIYQDPQGQRWRRCPKTTV